ncbi:SDR family NAD(P)-dependent oxidoreductase, partial [Actinokineospora sp.]|uniref:SDR family NAD(P)-dependent oxidoreductase n=1 Tax=Actinokineospora sp. TaxID=1872133 RepID=UPI003D6A347F
ASELYRKLSEGNFVRATYDARKASERLAKRKRFLHYGPNLHMIVVTLRCNETCLYCHASRADMDAVHTDMTPEIAERTVDLVFQTTSPWVTIEFQGGEPLVNYAVVQHIIEYARDKNRAAGKQLDFTMVSNLALLDDARLDAGTLISVSTARAEAILGAAGDDPGTMAAVSASRAETAAVLDGLFGTVVIANDNGPRQVVVSGPTADVEAALEALRAAGLSAQRISVACAFHSPLVAGAGSTFAEVLAGVPVSAPEVPVWSNRTASAYPTDPDRVRAELAAQIGSPVRFAEQIEAMHADGVRIFLEAGAGRVLSGLVGRILGDRPHTVIAVDNGGLPGFLDAVARLAVAGIDVRTGWLFSGRDARDVSTLTPPARPGWTIDGSFVRTVAGGYVGLAPARKVTLAGPAVSVPAASDRDEMVSDFLRTSRELIAAQRDVLLGYLGSAPAAEPVVNPVTRPVLEPVAARPAAVAASPDALTVVVEVIAARTGYPVEMIDPAVDLEADLSVDSIKRTEIAGEVASRLGLGQGQVDVLVKARTAAAMAQATGTDAPAPTEPAVVATDSAVGPLDLVIEVIAARTGYPPEMISPTIDLEADLSIDSIKRTEIAGEVASRLGLGQDQVDVLVKARTAAAMAGSVADKASSGAIEGSPAQRYVLELVDVDAEPSDDLTALVGKHILIAGGAPALATELADQLSARGALAIPFQGRPELAADVDRVDGLISLHALHDEDTVLPGTFALLKSALARGPKWVLAASAATPVAAGLRGLFRSLHREYPDLVARHIELDPAMTHDQTAELILTEVLTGRDEPAVVVTADGRRAYRMVPKALGALATSGAGPAGIGAAEAEAVGLTRDSVVLLIGGARGITAQVALAIGEAAGCHLELAGRTVLDAEPEPPAVLVARDLAGLRSALAGLGGRDLAGIEREAREILARREVTATLREIRGTGATAEYHTLDVRDGDAVRQLIKQVHTAHGRLDGVVYAAGVIEDRLVAEKDPKSFERVYGTKVDGANALLAELGDLAVDTKFVVFFGSIAAALGNRGQADYAAANDAIESMAADWSRRTGNRALTVHWGPWAPVGKHSGMVSAELGRSYAERGIKLLDPADGVAGLLRELAWGDPAQGAVVYSASEW